LVKKGAAASLSGLSRFFRRHGITRKTYGPPRRQRMARPGGNVWPAPSASGFSVSGLICLHKRIRPSGEPLAKMESRAF